MLTLGFWLFAITLAAIFLNNTSWLLLPIFIILFFVAAKHDQKYRLAAKRKKWEILNGKYIRDNNLHFVLQEERSGEIRSAYETREKAQQFLDSYYLLVGSGAIKATDMNVYSIFEINEENVKLGEACEEGKQLI